MRIDPQDVHGSLRSSMITVLSMRLRLVPFHVQLCRAGKTSAFYINQNFLLNTLNEGIILVTGLVATSSFRPENRHNSGLLLPDLANRVLLHLMQPVTFLCFLVLGPFQSWRKLNATTNTPANFHSVGGP